MANNVPGSVNSSQSSYYDSKQANDGVPMSSFSMNMSRAQMMEQQRQIQMSPHLPNSMFVQNRMNGPLINPELPWRPPQSPIHLRQPCIPPAEVPSTMRHYHPVVTPANVVFVRPMGPQTSADNSLNENLPAMPNSTPQMKGHQGRFFGSVANFRGLSPIRASNIKSYPSYLVKSDSSNTENSQKLNENNVKSYPSYLVRGDSTSEKSQNENEIIGKAVRNLGKEINNVPSSISSSFSEQTGSSFSFSQRVRMGCNPAKRKRSNEKPLTPPQVLVISSDEEENDTPKDKSISLDGARIKFNKLKANKTVSETARHFAAQLSGSATNPTQESIDANTEILDYGLSLLEKPQRILDSLEEVLRERPTRLRVNLKNLYYYAKIGSLSKVLSMLLEEVSSASSVNSESGKTPLHAAASKGHLDVLIVLTYKAAGDIDVTDKFKRTPLYVAVEKGNLTAAQFLIKAGASVSVKNFEGMGLLHVAAHKGNTKMLRWLLTLQIPLNDQDNGGWTSLMWAAEEGRSDSLKLLISKGASGNLRDREMNTCLHWAAMTGTLQGCEDLLDIHCDVNAVNMYGDTPLHIAAREGNHDVVKLFLLRGADTSIRNNEDKLPMDVCVNNQQVRDTIRLRHAIGHVRLKRLYDCDISRGKERIAVTCINEVDDEPLPLNFTYIQDAVESETVNIMRDLNTVKGCKCKDDCAKAFCECIQRSEGGRCWFHGGILDAEFFELEQPVLVECSKICRCWSYCSNRVIQKGIQFPLEVFKTTSIGWGLRTLKAIPKGSFVLSYVGEVISDEEAERRLDDSYLFDLDMKESTDEDKCLDARVYGNCGRFINHSCDSNLLPVRVFTHHRDCRYPGIAFFACRDVGAYEELCFDYGDKFWEIKKKNGMRCQCKSSECKYG